MSSEEDKVEAVNIAGLSKHGTTLARFKRRYKVKTKNAPPFKMFLFIFREASEKKFFKKMMFSARR